MKGPLSGPNELTDDESSGEAVSVADRSEEARSISSVVSLAISEISTALFLLEVFAVDVSIGLHLVTDQSSVEHSSLLLLLVESISRCSSLNFLILLSSIALSCTSVVIIIRRSRSASV